MLINLPIIKNLKEQGHEKISRALNVFVNIPLNVLVYSIIDAYCIFHFVFVCLIGVIMFVMSVPLLVIEFLIFYPIWYIITGEKYEHLVSRVREELTYTLSDASTITGSIFYQIVNFFLVEFSVFSLEEKFEKYGNKF